MGHSWQKEQSLQKPCGKCEGLQEGLRYLGLESTRCLQQVRQKDNQDLETEGWDCNGTAAPSTRQVKRGGFRPGKRPFGT